ncbi:MAG: hypothetical protein WD050_03300 [Actinomycetota bacterium]
MTRPAKAQGLIEASVAEVVSQLRRAREAGVARLQTRVSSLCKPAASAAGRSLIDRQIAGEAAVWSAAIGEDLSDDTRDAVIDRLRAWVPSDNCDPAEWLDPARLRDRLDKSFSDLKAGTKASRDACIRWLETENVVHLRETVSCLEAAVKEYDTDRRRGPVAAESVVLMGALADSLVALAPLARQFFVAVVRHRVDDHRHGGFHGRHRDDEQHLSSADWTEIDGDEPIPDGIIFSGDLQAEFQREMDDLKNDRLKEQQRLEAEHRRIQEWEERNRARREQEALATAALDASSTDDEAPALVAGTDGVNDAVEVRKAHLRSQIDPARLYDPSSLSSMPLDLLEGIVAQLKWEGRHDAERRRREEDKEEYKWLLISRS